MIPLPDPMPHALLLTATKHWSMATSTPNHEIKREQERMTSHRKDKRGPTKKPTTRLIDLRTYPHCQKHLSISEALAEYVVEAVAALHLVDRVPDMTPDVQIRLGIVPRGVQKASEPFL